MFGYQAWLGSGLTGKEDYIDGPGYLIELA